MERSDNQGSRRPDEQEFSLKEWHLRARITRGNTLSRRYSGSYIRSFREDSRSFRSNFTISSTASSPGYLIKDEIDPSTYSFTTALQALQARSGYVWEWLSPENQGFALNSKWDEAERYICNPLSGEVPMECLSAKTLSGRSFRSYMAGRVTMSAPLVFSANPKKRTLHRLPPNTTMNNNKPAVSAASITASVIKQQLLKAQFPQQGTQSTLPPGEESSSSLSPASTPSIKERSRQRGEETEDGDAQNSSSSTTLQPVDEVEVKVTSEEEETKRTKEAGKKKNIKTKKTGQLCNCRQSSGCLLLSSSSWKSLWMKKRHREKKLKPSLPQTPK
ncbi:hypothetical protein Cgig2_022404 [Carnegiea gigantea]|uniref:Uncharacterized protein n=1 Tax=Carnegiea gigantea TaxID=171969 RepID=A0A9Q1KGP9_9CARY|nr:hypothetical protein Cgig2_022404 [Carnegiea gigantea]